MLERFELGKFREHAFYTACMSYVGCGIYSKLFFDKEKAYYDEIWEQLKVLSPKLTKAAEAEWEKEKQEYS